MVEAWKVKRELLRIWHPIADALTGPVNAVAKSNYDRNFHKLTHLTDGQAQVQDKFAIFLTYQPKALSRSVFVTCRYLKQQGYAVLLIVTTKLAEDDREALTADCWKILQRPNFGYDFGGYRDGLRVLAENSILPERLIILNDSIWFPMYEDTRLIDRLEAEGLPFNSPVFVNIPERHRKNRHFQSFFFLLRKEALQSQAFIDYWRDYRVSSNKRLVLRHGEKGFSQALFDGGFGGDAPSTKSVLMRLLEQQSNAFLVKTLSYAAYAHEDILNEGRALLADFSDNDSWRHRVLSHMRAAIARYSPIGVYVYASTLLFDFSFLKKRSFSDVFDGMRWQYLRAVKNGDLPSPHPDILAEIMASPMDGSLTTDPSIRTPVSATKVA